MAIKRARIAFSTASDISYGACFDLERALDEGRLIIEQIYAKYSDRLLRAHIMIAPLAPAPSHGELR